MFNDSKFIACCNPSKLVTSDNLSDVSFLISPIVTLPEMLSVFWIAFLRYSSLICTTSFKFTLTNESIVLVRFSIAASIISWSLEVIASSPASIACSNLSIDSCV